MEEKDGNSLVSVDAEKGKEDTEQLLKRVDELSSALETEKQRGDSRVAALQERFDDVSASFARQKRRWSQKEAIDKDQLDDVTDQLEKEKKRGEEYMIRDALFQREKDVLKRDNDVLKGEIKRLKEENEVLTGKEKMKENLAGMKRTLDECESEKRRVEIENEELRRRLREMEETKLAAHVKETGDISTQTDEESSHSLIVPKEEPIDFSHEGIDQSDNLSGISMDPIFTLPSLPPFKQEQIDQSLSIPENNHYSEDLGDEINCKEEEMPNDDVVSGRGDFAMNNSFIDHSLNDDMHDRGTISDARATMLADNSMNNFSLNVVDRIDQSEDSQTGEVERKKRPSRNSSKSVKYAESMDDSDDDGRPMKKSKSDSGKRNEIKRRSSLKKDQSVSASKAVKNDTELECPECDYQTISVDAFAQHLRLKHSTTIVLAGLALLCECGNESYSSKHTYECDIASVTLIRKRDGPIQRIDDAKVTPQCIMCEKYPTTALGYAEHLRKHSSTLNENGIYLLCSCGHEVRSNHWNNHSKECDGRKFTLHKLNEK